jgi:hypothetical protein
MTAIRHTPSTETTNARPTAAQHNRRRESFTSTVSGSPSTGADDHVAWSAFPSSDLEPPSAQAVPPVVSWDTRCALTCPNGRTFAARGCCRSGTPDRRPEERRWAHAYPRRRAGRRIPACHAAQLRHARSISRRYAVCLWLRRVSLAAVSVLAASLLLVSAAAASDGSSSTPHPVTYSVRVSRSGSMTVSITAARGRPPTSQSRAADWPR